MCGHGPLNKTCHVCVDIWMKMWVGGRDLLYHRCMGEWIDQWIMHACMHEWLDHTTMVDDGQIEGWRNEQMDIACMNKWVG